MVFEQGNCVAVTQEMLDAAAAYTSVRDYACDRGDLGAVVVFVGLVRELDNSLADGRLHILRLQHYPELTEASIHAIVEQARSRWQLGGVLVQHRVGDLVPTDEIVVVAVGAQHRAEAFDAARFLMDQLKTRVMLWKQVLNADESKWVAFKQSDADAAGAW